MDVTRTSEDVNATGGIRAHLVNGVWHSGVDRLLASTPHLRCKVQLDGCAHYEFGDQIERMVDGSRLVFFFSPLGRLKHEVIEPGVQERSVTIIYPVDAEMLGDLDRSDPVVGKALDSFVDRLTVRMDKVPLAIKALVSRILDIDDSARHFTKLRHARIDELSCALLDIFLENFCSDGVPALTGKERRQVEEARNLLLQDMAAPPTLAELAARVGTNRTNLNQGFRALYGASIFQYLQRERMRAACALLIADDGTITDIAARCGYEHLSNFSIAFKSHYGVSPSALRRRGVQP